MVKLVNRAKMTTATTGTGTITLGSAVSGYQTFAAAGVANTNVVRYVIEDGANWEIGSGTYTSSGTTLTRTPTESSSGGAAITLSGNAVVFVSATDDDLVPYATGTPVAVAYGGTGVTSSTGSGAVVLGTGPTITSGVYSGTVGASNPSTGAFTTVAASSTINVGATTQYGKISATTTGSVGTTWATTSAITATGTAFGGGIGIIDGSAGYMMYLTGSGANLFIRGAAVGSSLGGGVTLTNYATAWTSASDERIKTIIEPIEGAVNKVGQLRTVIGRYKDQDETHRHPFLIAQDVQAVLPEAVCVLDNGDGTDYLGVAYTEVIPLLAAAIKELSAENRVLEARIAALEA
jgi:hypothetical protein